MKFLFSFAGCLLIAMLCTTSCKKGDTGPEGPAGTANVIYSEWFKPNPYIKDTVFSIWGFKYNKAAPGITQKILDSGTVLTFGKLLGYTPSVWPANQVAQLPITLTYNTGGTQVDTWSALASPGNLRIRFTNDHNFYTSINMAHEFRYIILPGGIAGARTARMTYADICKQYNIPE